MFSPSSFKEKITKKISPGLLLFSAGIACYYAYKTFHAPRIALTEYKKTENINRLRHALGPHYPLCFESILEIYNAAGLMPLLEYALAHEKPENTLIALNTILQKMFLRPRGIERQKLNDQKFLSLLRTNLQTEYRTIGLTIAPQIDETRLRNLLSAPNIWENKPKESNPAVDTVILFGSTYLEYLNRQSFLLNLIRNKIIRPILNFNNNFCVYLLGGDRPLDPNMDKDFLDRFTSLERDKPSNEQEMMDLMFNEAVRSISLPQGSIVGISTNSPKENESRPTTAGTLESFIEKAQLHPDAEYDILAISSAPFIRYQELVTQRQLLKHNIRNVNLTVMGPDITEQMQAHSEVQENALIAATLDTLAREMWEIVEIMRLQPILTQSSPRRKEMLYSRN